MPDLQNVLLDSANSHSRHGLVHASPGYMCPFCPDQQHKYPRPDNLQRHVRVHHVDKDRDDPLLREVLAQRPGVGAAGVGSSPVDENAEPRHADSSFRAAIVARNVSVSRSVMTTTAAGKNPNKTRKISASATSGRNGAAVGLGVVASGGIR